MSQFIPHRWRLLTLAACLLLAVAIPLLLSRRPRDRENATRESDTVDNHVATYVGSEVCANCHADQHASYLLTAHSRAMSLVDPTNEPPDAGFEHPLSDRRFEVSRSDGQLWHAEIALPASSTPSDRAPSETEEIRVPLKYLVGSGRHSRTYLAELDGYLMESPVTWYESTQQWAMSPGYDVAEHPGFERAADVGCLVCHVGHIERLDQSLNRLSFRELAIGCERCHGPGSEHVDKWNNHHSEFEAAADDDTIVHPGRLSRELQDAICADCHLRGDATVVRPGRLITDFRPGQPLETIRIDYQLTTPNREMEVVGHMEQMRASLCYQNSETMTCLTCHDLHAPTADSLSLSGDRGICLSCHQPPDCGLEVTNQRRVAAADDCVECHMPQVDTDIPHIAFTHHRIGIHQAGDVAEDGTQVIGELVPIGDVSQLTVAEQSRNLSLAYAELTGKQEDPEFHQTYRSRAITLLREVQRQGAADGDVYATLARYAWEEQQSAVAIEYATQALNHPQLSMGGRDNALYVLGDGLLQLRRSAEAVPVFEQLVRLRRQSDDWLLLGVALYQSGQPQRGIEAVRRAGQIQPLREDIQRMLLDMQRHVPDADDLPR